MAAVAVGAEPVVAVDAARRSSTSRARSGRRTASSGAGAPEATAEAVREVSGGGVDYAIEATGRPEAMEAAFLSTRNRGAAVLIGIPRADAVLTLPALTIPRMERRVLGSIYGSTKPERDFSHALDLYRDGRLAARSPRLPSAAARGGRARIRAHALRRCGRVVLWRLMNLDELDGRIGEGWSGEAPNGWHVNVVLARRGSPTAAAAISMLAHPAPGHTPVLVCVGPTQADYEPVWPPTLMMNKATATDDRHQTLTWGAAQLGIAQGVLDAVADGLRRGERRPARARRVLGRPRRRRRDCAPGREPRGDAQGDRHLRRGSGPERGRRARRAPRLAAQPVLLGRVSRCASRRSRRGATATRSIRPIRVAWDPVPRTHQEATVAIVRSDDGVEGYASGDALPDRELLERLLVGVDPADRRQCTGSARPSTCTTVATGPRGGGLGPRRRGRSGSRSGSCSAADASGSSRTRRAASWSRRTSVRSGASRCAIGRRAPSRSVSIRRTGGSICP